MGDRPPLSTVDSGWEDDDRTMERSIDQDPAADPVGWQPSAQAQEIARAARDSGAAVDPRASSTMALQRDQLDPLIADSASTTGEVETVSLGSREIQQLLDDAHPPDTGGFRVGGPVPKPKESGELNFDAFEEGPPTQAMQAPLPPATPPPLDVPPSRYGPPPAPPPAVPAWPEPQQYALPPPAVPPRNVPPPAAPPASSPARAWALEVAARIAADAQVRAQPKQGDPRRSSGGDRAPDTDVRASREITSPGELDESDPGASTDPDPGIDPGGSTGADAEYTMESGGEPAAIVPETYVWSATARSEPIPVVSGLRIAQGYAPVPPPPPPPPSAPISAPWSEPLSSEPLSSEPLSSEPLSSEPLSSEPLSSEPLSMASREVPSSLTTSGLVGSTSLGTVVHVPLLRTGAQPSWTISGAAGPAGPRLGVDVQTAGSPSLRQSPRGVHFTILVAALVSFAVALCFAIWFLLLRKGDKPPVAAAPRPKVAGLVHSTPSISTPLPPVDVDTEARRALERLREGVAGCVRDTIRVLPGSSPAVPPTLKRMKEGVYESTVLDWRTPVWVCSKYRVTGPQRFQIQWQQDKVPSSGMGVAWIDANGDGVADRAFGFKATLKQRGEVEMSEVQAIDASRPVAVAR